MSFTLSTSLLKIYHNLELLNELYKLDNEILVDPIELDTAGPDSVNVTALGDVQHLPGLETKQGLIAPPWSDVTLLLITKRLKVGGTFWCEKDFAVHVLLDPEIGRAHV